MKLLIAAVCLAISTAALAQDPAPDLPQTQDMLIEIYRIAPGKHREFLEAIASYDEANRLAGLPPRQLYVHQDGANWDFLLIQPAKTPEDKREALDTAWEKLGLPSGPDFFFTFRSMIAEHSDTFVGGPTTAANYLAQSSKSTSSK